MAKICIRYCVAVSVIVRIDEGSPFHRLPLGTEQSRKWQRWKKQPSDPYPWSSFDNRMINKPNTYTMKTDLFTKTVLTVIAICLIINVLNQIDIIPKAYANDPIYTLEDRLKYALIPVNEDGSIDVNIKTASTIDVNIESCAPTAFYYAEPIQVEIN